MRRILITFGLLTFCLYIHYNSYGQKKFPYGGVYFYGKVDRYIYNDSSQSYVFIDSLLTSKAISIDPVKIFIESFDQSQDLTLKIIDYFQGDSTKKNLYICKSNDCIFYFQVSRDRSESVLIFNNQKIVFHSNQEQQREKTKQSYFIPIDKEVASDSIVYLDFSVDIKPIYKTSLDYETSLLNFQRDLENFIIQICDTLEMREIILSFIINKDGLIVKPSLLMGGSTGKQEEECILSIIKTMSGWTSGVINDNKVSTISIITINPNRK